MDRNYPPYILPYGDQKGYQGEGGVLGKRIEVEVDEEVEIYF